jgi:hypothetical protein
VNMELFKGIETKIRKQIARYRTVDAPPGETKKGKVGKC